MRDAQPGELTLLRARMPKSEYAEIRKEAIDEGQHTADYVTELLRLGREAKRAAKAKTP